MALHTTELPYVPNLLPRYHFDINKGFIQNAWNFFVWYNIGFDLKYDWKNRKLMVHVSKPDGWHTKNKKGIDHDQQDGNNNPTRGSKHATQTGNAKNVNESDNPPKKKPRKNDD